MSVDIIEMDGVTVIAVEGRVDSSNADVLHEALEQALASGATRLVADLEATEYVTSVGLRELVTAFKQVTQRDGDLKLSGPSERIREILTLTGLDSIFSIYETRREAIDSF